VRIPRWIPSVSRQQSSWLQSANGIAVSELENDLVEGLVAWSFRSAVVQYRLGREVDAGVVQAGKFVAQVHGDAVGEAGDDPEDASFPSGAGKASAEPICTIGPSRPTESPDPMVSAEAPRHLVLLLYVTSPRAPSSPGPAVTSLLSSAAGPASPPDMPSGPAPAVPDLTAARTGPNPAAIPANPQPPLWRPSGQDSPPPHRNSARQAAGFPYTAQQRPDR
jgi:hypothetical protein